MICTTPASSNPSRNVLHLFLPDREHLLDLTLGQGVDLDPVPAATNPVTPRVFRTTYHESLS
jgi:hypothetical protein